MGGWVGVVINRIKAKSVRLALDCNLELSLAKAQKHPKFSKWFKPNTRSSVTRSRKNKFCKVYYRTERFNRSPISYFTRLLNSQRLQAETDF